MRVLLFVITGLVMGLVAMADTAPSPPTVKPDNQVGNQAVPQAQTVQIEFIANAAFRFTGPGGDTMIIDPFKSRWWIGYDWPEGLTADFYLVTHPHPDHNQDRFYGGEGPGTGVFYGPGEREMGSFRITGFEGKHAAGYGREFEYRNTIMLIEAAGLRILHIGDNGPVTDDEAAAFGRIDILMLPIDGEDHLLTPEEVAVWRAQIKPKILIPMHFRHNDLEPLAGWPLGLGDLEPFLETEPEAHMVGGHSVELSRADLPDAPTVWVFEHSPDVLPPEH